MRRGWQVATVLLILFSAFVLLIGVFGAPFLNSRPLPLQDKLGPGPGFFPAWLSLIALVLGGMLLLEVSRRPPDGLQPYPTPSRPALLKALGAVLVLGVAAWKFPTFPLLEWLGVASETLRGTLASLLVAATALALTIWPNREPELSHEGAVLRIAAVLGHLLLAAALLDPLGFRASALVFTSLLLIALGAPSPKVLVPFALTSSLGVFYVFYHTLKVPLPIGPYDWVLKPVEMGVLAAWSAVTGLLSVIFR